MEDEKERKRTTTPWSGPTSAHTTIGKTNDMGSDSHQHGRGQVKRGEFVCITTRMCDHRSGRSSWSCTGTKDERGLIQVKGENP